MNLTGIHHLTAITNNPKQNLDIYTNFLGLRLVKKTVNQDDVSAYHLFYADNVGSPGTDMTFFHWNAKAEIRGTNSISRSGFRVLTEDALKFWELRIKEKNLPSTGITQRDNHQLIEFEDYEGQRLLIINEPLGDKGFIRENSDIPEDFQIQGLGPVMIRVQDIDSISSILSDILFFKLDREYLLNDDILSRSLNVKVFKMSGEGSQAELHVIHDSISDISRQGAGGVHHVAFRIPTFSDYDKWTEHLKKFRVPSSGPIDRFYFKSLYFRERNGILFELATDEPGFTSDESLETLGQNLSLPPFLEDRREEIEKGLVPL